APRSRSCRACAPASAWSWTEPFCSRRRPTRPAAAAKASTTTEAPSMIARLIRASAERPLVALLLAAVATHAGVFAFRELRRDVFPDLSAPLFNVIVQNAAMGPEELETAVAIPLETALAGIPGARRVRSVNQL